MKVYISLQQNPKDILKNDNEEYNLTIISENRAHLGIFLALPGILGPIILAVELGSYIWFILFFVAFLFLFYYFLIGHLTVIATKDELQFQWTRKLIFNYREIEPVRYDDIETLVIDNGQFLRKIITSDRTIAINTSKIKPKGVSALIGRLAIIAKKRKIKIIDSWDVLAEKSYIKIFYWITTIVLVLGGLLIIVAIANGVYSRNFFLLLLFLPQQYFFRQQMKHKLDKKKLQQNSN